MIEQAELPRLGRHAPHLIDVFIEARRAWRGQSPQGAEKAQVRRPVGVGVAGAIGDRMAVEPGLRIGLGQDGAGQHVGDGALARPGPADHGEVQRPGLLSFQKRPDHVANHRRRQP